MPDYPYILFNKSPEQLRRLGGRGGRAYGHVSSARICQYMTLLHLAPAIQEYLLFLAVTQSSPISEAGLRRIAREPRWDRQRALFESLLAF